MRNQQNKAAAITCALLGGAAALLSLQSCSAINATTNMDKTTQQMAANTKEMDDTTKKMNDTTSQLQAAMDETNQKIAHVSTVADNVQEIGQNTYTGLRQGDSILIREKALSVMEKAPSMEAKVLDAGIYMVGFEYQLWTGQGLDDQARLEGLYDEAFIELDKDLRNYWFTETDQMPLDPTSSDKRMMNIFAFASALQQVNENQIQRVANLQKTDPKAQTVSVLDLIEKALTDNVAVENGTMPKSQLERYETEMLPDARDYIYLLQVRANFLPLYVLTQLTSLEYASLTTKLSTLASGFTPDLSELGFAQIDQLNEYLGWAVHERDFLKSIGSDPKYNCRLALLYNGMRTMDGIRLKQAEQASLVGLQKQLKKFTDGLPTDVSTTSCLL